MTYNLNFDWRKNMEGFMNSVSPQLLMTIMSMLLIGGALYLVSIKPQQKEQKRKQAMLGSMAIGDYVLTTSGFYGTIIDIQDDTVIVEFGNNKNCRIPMQKEAISQIEKVES